MKKINLILLFLFFVHYINAQVTAGELVGIHNVTTIEMNAIITPVSGSLIYNTDTKRIMLFDGIAWVKMSNEESKTIILNRDGGSLPTQLNTFFPLPLGSTNLQTTNINYFAVTGNAEITILNTGNYLISGELSTTNMPSGETKYILAVFINNVRRGYLSRGFASLPSQDYWGTTGTLMYALNVNDKVSIRYVINASGATLGANFLNIGITKV